jgi:hypothetical protein
MLKAGIQALELDPDKTSGTDAIKPNLVAEFLSPQFARVVHSFLYTEIARTSRRPKIVSSAFQIKTPNPPAQAEKLRLTPMQTLNFER